MHEPNKLKIIAERAICSNKSCGMPNLLWQPWRNLFRCGWCKRDYSVTDAFNLKRLSDEQYKKVMKNRRQVLSAAKETQVTNG